jgi:Putative bacterial sensory transduction regulator
MKRLVFAVVLLGLLATPAFAVVTSAPVSATGITMDEMAQLMIQRGWPAKIGKDSSGTATISSRVNGVNFDMYFYECTRGRCTDIQFAAGWSNAKVTPDQIDQWNATKRFLRAYWKPGNVLWTEMDARIALGSTGNIDEYLALWPQMLHEFTSFMHI